MTAMKEPLKVSNMKSSFLIRKSSCHSLVDIPTFVSSNILLKPISSDSKSCIPVSETYAGISLVETLANYQPIIKEEERKKKQLIEQHVMCMATMFLVCCLMMVGTMFAVTSQYQDMIVATMINVSNHHFNTVDDKTS